MHTGIICTKVLNVLHDISCIIKAEQVFSNQKDFILCITKVLLMKQNKTSPLETLTEIRDLMERSSRFISLSGLSGVFAGLYALAGAYAAYKYLNLDGLGFLSSSHIVSLHDPDTMKFLIADAAIVLVLAVGTGIFLTTVKAAKDGNSIFDSTAKKLIVNLSIPLITGGIFCLALGYHDALIY